MRNAGFTLVELLVTLTIVALLGALSVPVVNTVVQRRQEQELRVALREIRQGIDAYKRAYDQNRLTKITGASGYPPKLEMLVEGVSDAASPTQQKLYFLRRIPRDPFNPDPDKSAAESWGKRSYASPPDKPQEGDDVYDVYSLTERTGLNGVPYRQW
jgi:general secretion pathway protein G